MQLCPLKLQTSNSLLCLICYSSSSFFLIGNTVGMETTQDNWMQISVSFDLYCTHLAPGGQCIHFYQYSRNRTWWEGLLLLPLRLAPHNCRHIRAGLLYCIIKCIPMVVLAVAQNYSHCHLTWALCSTVCVSGE